MNSNLTFTDFTEDSVNSTRPFVLPYWQQVAWIVAYGIMVSTAVMGNAIIMWIIIAHRRMKTVTNYFLLNLSIADFMIATFNVIFNFIFMLESDWPFGMSYCIFSNFVANVAVSSSVFTMTAMSIDRYMAIVRPLTERASRKAVYFVITLIWTLSALLALPTLLYSTTETYFYKHGEERTLCLLLWPDGRSNSSLSEFWYNVVFLLLTYVIPMVAMAITYSRMAAVLWGSSSIGEITESQEAAIKSKQKVVKMLFIVVMLFAFCWLPYHVYFIYAYHNSALAYTDYIQNLYLGIYWIAMSNSMYNPIIYYWMNARFRAYFEIVLCWCWYRNERHRKARHWNLQRNSPVISRTVSYRFTLTKSMSVRKSFKKKYISTNLN